MATLKTQAMLRDEGIFHCQIHRPRSTSIIETYEYADSVSSTLLFSESSDSRSTKVIHIPSPSLQYLPQKFPF